MKKNKKKPDAYQRELKWASHTAEKIPRPRWSWLKVKQTKYQVNNTVESGIRKKKQRKQKKKKDVHMAVVDKLR